MSTFSPLRNALTLCLAAAALTSCTTNAPASLPPMSMPVRLQTLNEQSVSETSEFMGTLKSRKSSILQPQVSGVITKIYVTSGANVGPNAPLIEINPEKQRASLNSYLAANQSSQDDRASAEQTLRALEATKLSKESNLNYAKRQIRRYGWLNSQGAVSGENVDNYTNQLKIAEAELKACEAQIEAQKAAIAKMTKMVKQTEASSHEQQVELQYHTIRAPFAGEVGDIPVKVGEYVDSQSKLTTVTQNQPLEVYVNVPAERAAALKKGMTLELLDGNNKVQGTAKIFFIAPNVSDESQSVLVKAEYLNINNALRSNQTVSSRIIWDTRMGLMVPTQAVAHISGQDFVFVASGTAPNIKAQQKPVDLGDIEGNSYIVKSGLAAGDRVITSGTQNLIDGMPITPQP